MTPSKKGLSFIAVRDYVLATHGRDGWEAIMGGLPREDTEALGTVLSVGWYPLEAYARLVHQVDRTFGRGDLATVFPIIRFEAERDLPTIHRMLLRMVRTSFAVEKMGELWSRYNSSGRFDIKITGDRSVETTIVGWSSDRALCLGTQAYCERALELAGARAVKAAHPKCRSTGDDVCLMRFSWGGKS